MPRYAALLKNLDARTFRGIKTFVKSMFASQIGKGMLLAWSKTIEKLLPAKNHNTSFGLLTSSYFRAGYRNGLKRFAR
ncbi:MAG: hypothetical protein IPI68_14895 [Chitinophagaceae bacterium]|nr:hypothetical protein [Chitinophagaceae bacterium]